MEKETLITQEDTKSQLKLTPVWNKINSSKVSLFSELEQFKSLLENEETRLLKEQKSVEEEKLRWDMEKEEMTRRFSSVLSSKRIQLDVGGHLFSTTLETLTKVQDTMLASMFSGRFELKPTEDNRFFIDRDGTHFRYILNYLRDLEVDLPSNLQARKELLKEAQYYNIDGLSDLILQETSISNSSSSSSSSSFGHSKSSSSSSLSLSPLHSSSSGPLSCSSSFSLSSHAIPISSSITSLSPSSFASTTTNSSSQASIPWKWEAMHLGESVYNFVDNHIACKDKMNGTIYAIRAQPGFPANSSKVIRWKIEIEDYGGDDFDLGVCNDLCNGNKAWLRADVNALGLCQANARRSRFSQLQLYPNCSFIFAYDPTFKLLEVVSDRGERASWNVPDNWDLIYPAVAIRKVGCRVTITTP